MAQQLSHIVLFMNDQMMHKEVLLFFELRKETFIITQEKKEGECPYSEKACVPHLSITLSRKNHVGK